MQKNTSRVADFPRRCGARITALFVIAVLCAGPAYPDSHKNDKNKRESPSEIAALWNDPGDIKARDLYYGPGGKEHQPHGPMTFVEEDSGGTNPKFDVKDANGEAWRAKLGVEAQPETAAVRLLWAIGYFADADYFVRNLRVDGMQRLKRGGAVVASDGDVHDVRLKLKDKKKDGSWHWKGNRFSGTREFNGLRVMMALVNNWDLKDENNAIYKEKDKDKESGRKIYAVSDMGSTFGTSGYHYYGGWSKNDLEAYSRSKFISHVHKDYVDFNPPTHPPLIYIFGIVRWVRHLNQRGITKHIPRADAKWVGGLLAQLTPKQIRDAFRAAGYNDAQVDILTSALRERIAQLNQL